MELPLFKLYSEKKILAKTLFCLAILFSLSSCSLNLPSSIWGDDTVVSKNPNIVPDIRWQTSDQRDALKKEAIIPERTEEKTLQDSEAALENEYKTENFEPLYTTDENNPSEQSLYYDDNSSLDNNEISTENDYKPYDRKYSSPIEGSESQPPTKFEKPDNFESLQGDIKQETINNIDATYQEQNYSKVKVSILLPLSGRKSKLGKSMLNAAQMALFDVGSANFELAPIDTKGTKEGALVAAQKAINSNTDLILGPIFAKNLKAIKPLTRSSNTPVISFTTDWTLADSNTYIMGFLPFTQAARVAKYAQRKGYSNFAIFAPKTEYCDVVIRTFKNVGVHISRIGRYAANQPDLSNIVKDFVDSSVTVYNPNKHKKKISTDDNLTDEKTDAEIRLDEIMKELTENEDIKEKKIIDFDTLVLPVGNDGLNKLINEFELNDIDQTQVKYLGTGLWDDERLTKNPSLYGGWFAAPDPKMRADFEKRFKENFGYKPFRIASLAYDATALAAVLARTAQNGSSPYSADILTNPRGFTGIDGLFRFRKDGLSERGLAVLEIRAGKAKVVDTAPTAFILPDDEQ